jgi:hypothetical protein
MRIQIKFELLSVHLLCKSTRKKTKMTGWDRGSEGRKQVEL